MANPTDSSQDLDALSTTTNYDPADIVIDEDDPDEYGIKTKIELPNKVLHTFSPRPKVMVDITRKLNTANAMFKKMITNDELVLGYQYKINGMRRVDVKKFGTTTIILDLEKNREYFLPGRYARIIVDNFYDNKKLALTDHNILSDDFYMTYRGMEQYGEFKIPHLSFQYILPNSD